MPFKLDTTQTKTTELDSFSISSFAAALPRSEIYISVDELDVNSAKIGEETIMVVEPNFTQSIMDANAAAVAQIYAANPDLVATHPGLQVNVYAALKEGLYKQVQAAKGGDAGVIV